MKYLKITAIIPFLFLVIIDLQAQKTVPSTGGEATGTGGASSYTIGQVVYSNYTGTNGSVAQGVQQPYEISTTIGVKLVEINLDLAAYPNPTQGALLLNIGNYNNEKLTYQLYDIQGKLLSSKQVIDSTTSIDMQNLPTSTYLLNVQDGNTLIKTFKIVKN